MSRWLVLVIVLVVVLPGCTASDVRDGVLTAQNRVAVSRVLAVRSDLPGWTWSQSVSHESVSPLPGMPLTEVDFTPASSGAVSGTIDVGGFDPASAAAERQSDNESTATSWESVSTSFGPGIVSVYPTKPSSAASGPVDVIIWLLQDSKEPVRIEANFDRPPAWVRTASDRRALARQLINWLGLVRE